MNAHPCHVGSSHDASLPILPLDRSKKKQSSFPFWCAHPLMSLSDQENESSVDIDVWEIILKEHHHLCFYLHIFQSLGHNTFLQGQVFLYCETPSQCFLHCSLHL